MIATDRQLHRARAELDHLRAATRSAEAESPHDIAPELARAEWAGIQAQIDELAAEIQQFEDLKAGRVQLIAVSSLLDLPRVLIAARIAAGLTQAELAERIGVSQQQVQQDEAGGYERASLERLHATAALLDVRIQGEAHLPARGSLRPIPRREDLIRGHPTTALSGRSM